MSQDLLKLHVIVYFEVSLYLINKKIFQQFAFFFCTSFVKDLANSKNGLYNRQPLKHVDYDFVFIFLFIMIYNIIMAFPI